MWASKLDHMTGRVITFELKFWGWSSTPVADSNLLNRHSFLVPLTWNWELILNCHLFSVLKIFSNDMKKKKGLEGIRERFTDVRRLLQNGSHIGKRGSNGMAFSLLCEKCCQTQWESFERWCHWLGKSFWPHSSLCVCYWVWRLIGITFFKGSKYITSKAYNVPKTSLKGKKLWESTVITPASSALHSSAMVSSSNSFVSENEQLKCHRKVGLLWENVMRLMDHLVGVEPLRKCVVSGNSLICGRSWGFSCVCPIGDDLSCLGSYILYTLWDKERGLKYKATKTTWLLFREKKESAREFLD